MLGFDVVKEVGAQDFVLLVRDEVTLNQGGQVPTVFIPGVVFVSPGLEFLFRQVQDVVERSDDVFLLDFGFVLELGIVEVVSNRILWLPAPGRTNQQAQQDRSYTESQCGIKPGWFPHFYCCHQFEDTRRGQRVKKLGRLIEQRVDKLRLVAASKSSGCGISLEKRKPIPLSAAQQETVLERFTRKRATEQLREALANQMPVVKECVVLRLCEHWPYDKLARKLELTREQVGEILEKVRPWVYRFTTYFEDDWYWVEGVSPGFGI